MTHRHPQPLSVRQQRHRVEVLLQPVQSGAVQVDVERRTAAGTRQSLPRQRAGAERARAHRAGVAVGVQRAAHRTRQHGDTVDRHDLRFAGRRTWRGQRGPAGRRSHPDLQHGLAHHALDVDAGQLGRGELDRALDRRPHGLRRRRAARAAALQPQVCDTVVGDAEVLDATRVRPEVGPHLVQRALDAGVDGVGVQAVHQQQALHQRIGRERPDVHALGDPFEGVAVQPDEQPDQFLGAGRQRGDQLLDARTDFARVGHVASVVRPAGEWTCWSTFPLPRNMCTPHGRHGST